MQRQGFSEPARTNEEANRRNRAPVTTAMLIECWIARRTLLARQLELLESGEMRTGTDILGHMVKEDTERTKSWIAELDALIADCSN
jgi:hypothetical protein